MKAEMKFPKPSLETLRTFDELRTQRLARNTKALCVHG